MGMSTMFYLVISAFVFIFGLYEMYRADVNKNIFRAGIFLFMLQFVVLPFVIMFVDWFIIVGAMAQVPEVDYVHSLFLGSIFIALYYFFKTVPSYMHLGSGK